MKRKLLWMPIALITFLLGLLPIPLFDSGLSDCVIPMRPVPVVDYLDCKPSRIFPGHSIRIAELKGRRGYFPRGTYGAIATPETMNEWYGKHLKAMREPTLLKESNPGAEVYRFLWLRTFDDPMAVRVERIGSNMNLFVRRLSGSGGYDPGELIFKGSMELDQARWCTFMAKLERANYWNEPLDKDYDSGNDGAQWILEGVREGRYHVVDRWSPRSGEFREVCIYLLELAGVETAKLGDELY